MVDQISNPIAGANAYKAAQNLGGQTEDIATPSGDLSFGALLKEGIGNTIDAVKKSEQVSAEAVLGKANLVDVTQAVTAARLSVDTLTAVRDNAIDAYNRILQMPI